MYFSPIARERSSFFFSLQFLLLAFVEASAAKKFVLNCLPAFFCGAESSINALDVVPINSWDSFSIFICSARSVRMQADKKYLNVEV